MCGIGGLLLGMFGAMAVARLVLRRRWRGGGWGGGGPGGSRWHRHHDHGAGGWGGRGEPGSRGGGRGLSGISLRWLARELELNPRQRDEVEEVLTDLRAAFAGLRGGQGDLGAMASAFGDDSFDKARVEEIAGRREAAMVAAKKSVVEGLEHLHAVLIPEQRQKLRDLLSRFGVGAHEDAA